MAPTVIKCPCVNAETLRELLDTVARGELAPDAAFDRLRGWPQEDLGFARLDHQRGARQGFPEVIFAQGKTPEQVREIALSLRAMDATVLATRATAAQFEAVNAALPAAEWHESARCIRIGVPTARLPGLAGVICAGTTDLPVADEAALTLETMGAPVVRITDVGVAGLHRVLSSLEVLRECDVLVCAAGMEGALPSVVAGLVDAPVVAVPTSVGYGAAFGGLAALLGMLNSCAKGVAVVNIDNGFGAGAFAASILRGRGPATGLSEGDQTISSVS